MCVRVYVDCERWPSQVECGDTRFYVNAIIRQCALSAGAYTLHTTRTLGAHILPFFSNQSPTPFSVRKKTLCECHQLNTNDDFGMVWHDGMRKLNVPTLKTIIRILHTHICRDWPIYRHTTRKKYNSVFGLNQKKCDFEYFVVLRLKWFVDFSLFRYFAASSSDIK